MTIDEMYQCADLNDYPHGANYYTAFNWYVMAANHGKLAAQRWLGQIYEADQYSRQYGISPDPIQAYKWCEIGAATHGACIENLPPAKIDQEDNSIEITHRNRIAKTMTHDDKSEAQRLVDEWRLVPTRQKEPTPISCIEYTRRP
jgi:TPR repeat protein